MSWLSSLIDGPITVYTYGEPDADGVRPVTGTVPGYHLNIAPWLMTDELAVYSVVPQAPARIFAGGSTGFLKFPDEATAKALLADYWIKPGAD
jgi:hypothetical protein